MYNLLSNALKYNFNGAHVEVILEIKNDGDFAVIQVKDNGNGLSNKTMNNLFKRFYDGDFRKFNTIGNGIGLSLVKDLVLLHKGEINVDNKPGYGVNFIFTIPIKSKYYSSEELIDNQMNDDNYGLSVDNDDIVLSENVNYNILVVEDNPELLLLLKYILSKKYNVLTSKDGNEALDIIRDNDIHIVISDVMMPIMDGYSLCNKIKESIEYCHIPVILLTAKVADEDIVDAYNNGADAYIKKPFSLNVLNARIINLLKAREKRISDFKSREIYNPQGIDYTSHDEELIKSVMDCIYNNYTDADFDQNRLLEIIGISKSTMYRKIKSLTGMTISALIKNVRLKASYEILSKNKELRISEVAYMVGFSDPKYFSLCFKKEYGVLPSENIND